MLKKTNNTTEQEKPRVIATLQNDLWVFVYDYLELLNTTPAKSDKGFARYFGELSEYVYGKIKLPKDSDDIIKSGHAIWLKHKGDKDKYTDEQFEQTVAEIIKDFE